MFRPFDRQVANTLAALLPPANEAWGKVIFSVACVKNSVHWEVPGQVLHPLGRYTSPQAGTTNPPTPQGRYTPRQVHPLGRYTPPEQCMLGDTGNKRAVRILLECILVS